MCPGHSLSRGLGFESGTGTVNGNVDVDAGRWLYPGFVASAVDVDCLENLRICSAGNERFGGVSCGD